jgi:4-carboxymuconolactone decarboxylase
MRDLGSLSERQRELIAIGAAIAAGCRPCAIVHFKWARAAGATDGEIRLAVERALEARRSAAVVMARLAESLLGSGGGSDLVEGPSDACLGELISAGAALAVNCGADLAAHVARARDLGASDQQLSATLDRTRAVKSMAGGRVEVAARRVLARDDPGTGERARRAAREALSPEGCPTESQPHGGSPAATRGLDGPVTDLS